MFNGFLKFIADSIVNKRTSFSHISAMKIPVSWLGHNTITSGHPIEKTEVKGKRGFFKHNTHVLSRCEVAFENCYRLLLGNRSTKTVMVCDEVGAAGDVLGIFSEEIPAFVDIFMLQNTAKWMKLVAWDRLSMQEKKNLQLAREQFNGIEFKQLYEIAHAHPNLLDPVAGTIKFDQPHFVRGLADILVTSYVFAEEDLHKRNFGVDVYGIPRRIDFGMSFCKVVYERVRCVRVGLGVSGDGGWQISDRDIINFPILTDASPLYWPTINTDEKLGALSNSLGYERKFTTDDLTLFSQLAKNEEFIAAKYRCFLKLLLIPEKYFQKIFIDCFSSPVGSEIDKLGKDLFIHLRDRINVFRTTLCQIPEFGEFLTKMDKTKVGIKEVVDELFLRDGTTEQDFIDRYEDLVVAAAKPLNRSIVGG